MASLAATLFSDPVNKERWAQEGIERLKYWDTFQDISFSLLNLEILWKIIPENEKLLKT